MFQSTPICILTAGATVDGRFIAQSIIDDIAESYDPNTYNARINEAHWSWGVKYGSVLSVEKRGTELWAVLKPNSFLLRTIEQGQLLHTSCEITADFAKTGKSYLTGLALTDEPASLGTTEIHLSKQPENGDKTMLSSGATLARDDLTGKSHSLAPTEKQGDAKFIEKLKQMLGIKAGPSEKPDQEETEMEKETAKEIKALLEKNTTQAETLSTSLTALTVVIEKLSSQNKGDDKGGDNIADKGADKSADDEGGSITDELSANLDTLSSKFEELVVTLSKVTDENHRSPAGADNDDSYL